nr:MAG TPA: hypothetical protein [Caudoviricetes sp.]
MLNGRRVAVCGLLAIGRKRQVEFLCKGSSPPVCRCLRSRSHFFLPPIFRLDTALVPVYNRDTRKQYSSCVSLTYN